MKQLPSKVKAYINHSRMIARNSKDEYYHTKEWNDAMNALVPLMQMVEHPAAFKFADIVQFIGMRTRSLRNILPREGNFSRAGAEATLNEILNQIKV